MTHVTHADLVQLAARWLTRRGCHVVLTERGVRGRAETPDAIGWVRPAMHSILVECKMTLDDFRRDSRKAWRTGAKAMGCERWYLAPRGVLPHLELPMAWGLLEWTGHVVRRAVEADPNPEHRCLAAELGVMLSEVNAYQAQGLTYRKGAERWGHP